jgi:hypothetical protein
MKDLKKSIDSDDYLITDTEQFNNILEELKKMDSSELNDNSEHNAFNYLSSNLKQNESESDDVNINPLNIITTYGNKNESHKKDSHKKESRKKESRKKESRKKESHKKDSQHNFNKIFDTKQSKHYVSSSVSSSEDDSCLKTDMTNEFDSPVSDTKYKLKQPNEITLRNLSLNSIHKNELVKTTCKDYPIKKSLQSRTFNSSPTFKIPTIRNSINKKNSNTSYLSKIPVNSLNKTIFNLNEPNSDNINQNTIDQNLINPIKTNVKSFDVNSIIKHKLHKTTVPSIIVNSIIKHKSHQPNLNLENITTILNQSMNMINNGRKKTQKEEESYYSENNERHYKFKEPSEDNYKDNYDDDYNVNQPDQDSSVDKPDQDSSVDKPDQDSSVDKPNQERSVDKPNQERSVDKPNQERSANQDQLSIPSKLIFSRQTLFRLL